MNLLPSITSSVFVHLRDHSVAFVIEGPSLRGIVRQVPRRVRK